MNLHHLRHGWYLAIFLFCAALFFSNVLHWLIFRLFRKKQAEQSVSGWWGIQKHLGRPSRAIFLLTCVLLVLPVIPSLPDGFEAKIRHLVIMAIVVALGWFFSGLVYVFQDHIFRRYDITAADNSQARRVRTQFQVFRRLLIGFVIVITGGALLWTFNDPRIWHYGSGLLASAGIASLLLASAAKSTVSNLLAGIQIAFTELIHLDDVLIINGNYGRVAEITSSYVVLKIWDLRSLTIPLSYFIENPIENWTRQSSDIFVYPYLYVDYTVPVQEIRQEFERYVRAHPLWDGKVVGLQVTDLSERTMQLRGLASCRNSSDSFNLGCDIRERMIAYIQQHYPAAFPTARIEASLNPQQLGKLEPQPQGLLQKTTPSADGRTAPPNEGRQVTSPVP